MLAWSAGWQSVPPMRCIDSDALWDALGTASDSELELMTMFNQRQCLAWLDAYVTCHPHDSRWDAYRARRAHDLGQVS
jgi:hypothetical protein